MSAFLDVIRKNNKIFIRPIIDDINQRRDPEFFWPSGTQVYVGGQGSGKTTSAVKHILDLKERYPRSIIVTNLSLTSIKGVRFGTKDQLMAVLNHPDFDPSKHYIEFQNMEQLAIALVSVNNGFKGVIYLIDEIHTYFNALDSKNIPMYVFTEISQQRKQRKLIVGTSQLFLRMAKPLREQCDNLIVCNTVAGVLTHQKAYDGMSLEQDYDGKLTGNLKRRGWFFHSKKLRSAFDTYQKVVSGADQFEQINRTEITLNSKKQKIKLSTK